MEQDEYEYVLVEIPELHESDYLRSCREFEITGLNSASPKLVLDSLTFKGTVDETLGTQAFFRTSPAADDDITSADDATASTAADEVLGGARKRARAGGTEEPAATAAPEFVCTTTKRIRFTLQPEVTQGSVASGTHVSDGASSPTLRADTAKM